MTTFRNFAPVATIPEETIARFAEQVPGDVVDLWRRQGAGIVGDDGFFRVVDPERAATMLDGVFALPSGATVLFTTALGDLVVHAGGLYLVVKSRFGVIDLIEGRSFAEVVALIEDGQQRDVAWEWQPYPAAHARDGVPAFEQCFAFVPLLALGGPNTVDHVELSGLYEHLAVIAQFAGPPQVRRHLSLVENEGGNGTSAPASADWTPAVVALEALPPDQRALADVGRNLFERLAQDAGEAAAGPLNPVPLPEGLGVAVVRAVRGGGTIFVAPDSSVLYVGSAIDISAGLDAFREGQRTPLSKFE